jgi:hypothetical protein
MKTTYPGVYRGTVYSNRDPANQGRLRIQVPQLLSSTPTEWAWPITNEIVQSKLPEVGQGVWVMFEGGDLYYPVWLGVFGTPLTSGSRVQVNSLPAGTYPNTIVTTSGFSGKLHLQLIDTLLALAETAETLKGKVATLESKVATAEGNISSLETRVSNLESA